MVAPQHHHLLWTTDLHRQDQRQHLDGKTPPIDVVPQEHVLCRLAVSSHLRLQQSQKVIELSMQVTHDGDRVVNGDQIRLCL